MRAAAGLGAVGWGAALVLLAHAAAGDVFVVNNNLDTAGGLCPANPTTLATAVGNCSLRSAITAANATTTADLILFAPAVFATATSKLIAIASPLPSLTGAVEINATSSPLLTQRVQGIVIRAGSSVTDLLAVLSGITVLDDVSLEDGNVAVQAGTRIVFDQSVDAAFTEAITGTGSLQKQGTARLVLGGINSYGDTRIDAGTLQGDTQSIPGPGRIVQDAGLLVFDQEAADPPDFFGAISGSGRVQKIGAGTLNLALTANSYTGGTTVSAGILRGFAATSSAQGSLQGDIVDDAKLIFDQTLDGSFAGSITGTGSVEKAGAGVLVLTGANRYAGGTTISAGKLQGDADAIPANVAIAAPSVLVFDEPGAGTHGGGISGAGAVEKQGTGTLTLRGTNSYTGTTRVRAGALVGDTQSLQGDIDVGTGTTLAFDQSFTGSFTGLLGGAGALEKRGSGTLRLTAAHTVGGGFTGPTTVRGGRLELGAPASAQLPGNVSILSGAALGGIGVLGGTATASSGGAISPGNSVGTLHVGSAIFQSGSLFELDVTPTTADRLDVTGAATIDPGAKLRILPAPGTYPAMGTGAFLPVLVAGSKSGLFDTPADFAFLDVSVDQTGNQVLLKIESNGNTLTSLATSENQRQVAQALETAQAGGDPDLDVVFAELNPLLASDVPKALDAMTGEQLTEFATARLAIGDRFHASIQQRIRGVPDRPSEPLFAGGGGRDAALAASPLLFDPLSGLTLASASGANLAAAVAMQQGGLTLASPSAETGLGGWVDGYGIFGDVSGTSGTDDFDTTIWGVSAGVDTRIAERWIAGLAGGYAHSTLDFDGLPGQQEADTAQGAAYAGYVSPLFEAGAAFRLAWNGMHGERNIAFPPPSTFARSADSDFDGIDLGGHVEGALNLTEVSGISLQPVAALTYTHLQQDSFQETGAGSLSIGADEQEIDSIVSGVGMRAYGRFQLDEDLWLRPELRARWLHEFGDTERKLEARIGGVPGATYAVRGAELSRDSGSFGVSWTVTRAGRLHVFAEYDIGVNAEGLQHSAAVGVRILW